MPIRLLLTSAPRPAKPYRYFATCLPGHEMSWNQAPLWKIVNFLSIQGDSEPFQRQWADLPSTDRIKTSYRHSEPSKVIILNFRSWIIYRFSTQCAQIRHLGAFLLDKKLGHFLLQPRIKLTAVWDSEFLATLSWISVARKLKRPMPVNPQ